jgi:hypothetical protein
MITSSSEGTLSATSLLLSPPTDLAACVFGAIVRDTRGADLEDLDRFNFFPASPLVTVTHVVEGEVRLGSPGSRLQTVCDAPPLARTSVMPPQDTPMVSWCPGPVLVVTVAIYSDAWTSLGARCDLANALARAFFDGDDVQTGWARFCSILSPVWDEARGRAVIPRWKGGPRLSDWSHALIARAAQAGPGRGIRSAERRLKRWSGQTRRSLNFYAAIDDLHRIATQANDKPPSAIALEAGYADQSHMGRAVRRATGFSPVQLNRFIESEESFWFYRLSGERF